MTHSFQEARKTIQTYLALSEKVIAPFVKSLINYNEAQMFESQNRLNITCRTNRSRQQAKETAENQSHIYRSGKGYRAVSKAWGF